MPTPRASRWLPLTMAALLLAVPASAQKPGKPLLDQVVKAMGGQQRVLGVRTLITEGAGKEYSLGQNASPTAPLGAFDVTGYRRSFDFTNSRWRQEYTREPRFTTNSPAAQQVRTAYDSVAWDVLADGTPRRATGRADIDRGDQVFHHPIGFLRAALDGKGQLTEESAISGLRRLRMTVDGKRFDMLVTPSTKLPARIDHTIDHPVLGDVRLSTLLSEWRRTDSVMVPMHVRERLDDRWILSDYKLTAARVNADGGDLAAPTSVRSVTTVAAPINVTGQLIAPGVWYLAGETHHSVVIEMRDHLLLVESPQNDARATAVMQRARTLGSGKPLRAVIVTHHHFDHIGGMRAAIAEGLTVITHTKNTVFFEDLARRRHGIVPDALARAPRSAQIEGVSTKRVLSDSTRTVEIHHVRGNPHAETLLMVYLPAEKLLIEADAYNPPAAGTASPPPAPFAANLVENIDRLGLQVDYVVALHGRVVPMSDLRAAATTAAASTPPPPPR